MAAGRYAAFLSYGQADEALATWLHRSLEGYRIPESLVGYEAPSGPIGKRIGAVYLHKVDAEDRLLSAEARDALERSDALIVIRPADVALRGDPREDMRYFASLGRSERIVTALVEGGPRPVAPIVWRKLVDDGAGSAQRSNPGVAVDFRADTKAQRDGAKLKLIASLLDLDVEELEDAPRPPIRLPKLPALPAVPPHAAGVAAGALAVMLVIGGGVWAVSSLPPSAPTQTAEVVPALSGGDDDEAEIAALSPSVPSLAGGPQTDPAPPEPAPPEPASPAPQVAAAAPPVIQPRVVAAPPPAQAAARPPTRAPSQVAAAPQQPARPTTRPAPPPAQATAPPASPPRAQAAARPPAQPAARPPVQVAEAPPVRTPPPVREEPVGVAARPAVEQVAAVNLAEQMRALGAAHLRSTRCNGRSSQESRLRARHLIASSPEARRADLIRAFNEGYTAAEQGGGDCPTVQPTAG